MENSIKLKLETILEFQQAYPTSHVGGSIGLMLRGVDLKRDLRKSDLDITIDSFDTTSDHGFVERSDACDFDLAIRKDHEQGYYTKIDIRICPEPSFDVIEFDGHNYNVSKLRDILFWKQKYADKGHNKHKDDLIAIKTGVRPLEPVFDFTDDLPF
jgi:hypothetical protein